LCKVRCRPRDWEKIRKKKERWPESEAKEKNETLLDYLAYSPEEEWYVNEICQKQGMTWSLFEYIRALPSTPFDPLTGTDQIESEWATKAHQEAGLLAATAADDRAFSMVWLPRFVDWQSWNAEDDREMGLPVVELPLSRNLLEDCVLPRTFFRSRTRGGCNGGDEVE
jgi:hypothetical protein